MTFSCMIGSNNVGKTLINLNNYRVVLFDLDGTIAETEMAGHLPAFNAAFAVNNLNWCWDASDYKELLKITGGFERLRHYRDTLTDNKKINSNVDDATLKKIHLDKNEIYAKLIATGIVGARPGFIELIKRIWNLNREWGIVTTTSRSNWDAIWQASIQHRVDLNPKIIICGEDVKVKKPDPEAYLLAAKKLGLNPRQCLVVEDSSNGIAAARNAGMDVVGVKSYFFSDDDHADATASVDALTNISFEMSNLY